MNKPRRDITLGEMQDECVAYDCDKCDPCFKSLCALMTNELGEMKAPKFWNLTDPPRFNEAQMAALKQSYDSGVTKIKKTENAIHYTIPDLGAEIVITNHSITSSMEVGETLDLAELLGKDATQ